MQNKPATEIKDVIVIGGGQSALACGYYLRRAGVDYLILDKQEACGGAWRNHWDSLTLFSPSDQSSLPGWLMPKSEGAFPTKDEAVNYLCQYEERYKLNIQRPIEVMNVLKEEELFRLETSQGDFFSRAVISATGSWSRPFVPAIPGRNEFKGLQIHSSEYRNPEEFKEKKVLVVGEGNSGAQILAEVSKTASTTWATKDAPDFLPDDVDGRVLFTVASAKYYAQQKGEAFEPTKFNLGHIVMLPPVKEARSRNVLESKGSFDSLYNEGVIWNDGEKETFDVIIWCTGFRFATTHLQEIVALNEQGKIKTSGTRSIEEPGLWLVGYGGWTGFASATLIGVGRSARKTVEQVREYLKNY